MSYRSLPIFPALFLLSASAFSAVTSGCSPAASAPAPALLETLSPHQERLRSLLSDFSKEYPEDPESALLSLSREAASIDLRLSSQGTVSKGQEEEFVLASSYELYDGVFCDALNSFLPDAGALICDLSLQELGTDALSEGGTWIILYNDFLNPFRAAAAVRLVPPAE